MGGNEKKMKKEILNDPLLGVRRKYDYRHCGWWEIVSPWDDSSRASLVPRRVTAPTVTGPFRWMKQQSWLSNSIGESKWWNDVIKSFECGISCVDFW